MMHESSDHTSLSPSNKPGAWFQPYLDGLYRFAQALTLDEARATILVEETCHRAAREVSPGTPDDQKRQRLYQILMTLYRDASMESTSDTVEEEQAAPDAEAGPGENVPDYRRRVAEHVLERILPVAIMALPDELRALLLLCDVEGMPCERAADVLGIEPESACRKLDEAHQRVYEAIHAGATGHEWQLLSASLSSNWMLGSLRHVLRSEFAPLPSALRMSVDAAAATAGVSNGHEVARPAHARPPDRGPALPPQRNQGARLRGVLFAIVLVFATGLAAYFVSRHVSSPREQNLITLVAQHAGDVEIDMETSSPEDAERYVLDTFGLRLTLPEIDQAPLRGVSITEVTSDVKMPVFYYEDEVSEQPLLLFAYSYALLDRNRTRVTLAADILRQIEDDEHFDLHDLGAERVLVWRNRDDIFVAVTRGDAERLRERILFPS